MKKILGLGIARLGLAALAIPAAIASTTLIHPAVAVSDPVSANSLNVVGEPYGKALAILKGQGVKAFFGGSSGSDLPQTQCIVSQQKVTSGGRMYLNLDCTQKAYDNSIDSRPAAGGGGGAPGGPNVGSNGVTTVTPTPVGPQPGM